MKCSIGIYIYVCVRLLLVIIGHLASRARCLLDASTFASSKALRLRSRDQFFRCPVMQPGDVFWGALGAIAANASDWKAWLDGKVHEQL